MNKNPRSLFISHGGGPLPLLGDQDHAEMVDCLVRIAEKLPEPDAIIVISAHWESQVPTITAAESPGLIYDYYGFAPESYEIQYPCSGDPVLAGELYTLLNENGISAELDHERGFDHGMFVPLKIMYPDAHIPCIQLSLSSSLDPRLHILMGQAMKAISRPNVLIIGSGFSFHNMKAFFSADTQQSRQQNVAFEKWLADTCDNNWSEAERLARLEHWSEAPGARYCHPREEHLLPLHVCYGVAQRRCSERFELSVLGKQCSMYLW